MYSLIYSVLFYVILSPWHLELTFLIARFICSSTMWFGKSLLMRDRIICSHRGNIYIQHDAAAMRFVLEPTYSDFFVAYQENIFNYINKNKIYLRSVDDILLLVNSINELNNLQLAFQKIAYSNFVTNSTQIGSHFLVS